MHTNLFITKFHLHISANAGHPQGVSFVLHNKQCAQLVTGRIFSNILTFLTF